MAIMQPIFQAIGKQVQIRVRMVLDSAREIAITPVKPSPQPNARSSSFRFAEVDSPVVVTPSIASNSSTPYADAEGWSSAVGRATVGGKSGRVIERLMGDVDKLNRELKYSEAQLQEERSRCESATSSMESLRTTNANLSAIVESSKLAAQRRDRKLEELRVDLLSERVRREKAEKEKGAITSERDTSISQMQKDLVEAKMQAKEASTRYDILARSWRDLDQGHRRNIQEVQTQLQLLPIRKTCRPCPPGAFGSGPRRQQE